MLFLADENIPFVREAFSTLGDVRLVAGREINGHLVQQADALLVRSVTRVNAALLAGSRVKFVGTATIGTDHIDLQYLQEKGIAFASAAGCNANSVAEYLVAALLHVGVQRQIDLEGLTLGVIGVGNVGSRVAQKAHALGLKILLNDPPLEAVLDSHAPETVPAELQENLSRLASRNFYPLDDLMHADILTLHTPLARSGPYPTYHLFDETRLRMMKPGGVLINTARGEVLDNRALKKILLSGLLSAAILDVWEHEPQVDPELVALAALATPHIAGYSFEGKLEGTRLIYQALCRFLRTEPQWDYVSLLPQVPLAEIVFAEPPVGLFQGANENLVVQKFLCEAVRHAYDIAADDRRLRAGIAQQGLSKGERGKYFDKLRHGYPVRREFRNYRVRTMPALLKLREQLSVLGFSSNIENLLDAPQ